MTKVKNIRNKLNFLCFSFLPFPFVDDKKNTQKKTNKTKENTQYPVCISSHDVEYICLGSSFFSNVDPSLLQYAFKHLYSHASKLSRDENVQTFIIFETPFESNMIKSYPNSDIFPCMLFSVIFYLF